MLVQEAAPWPQTWAPVRLTLPTGSGGAMMPARITSRGLVFTPPCAPGAVKKLMYLPRSVSLPPCAGEAGAQCA